MTLTAEQLVLRKKHLGASESGAVLGLSPFQTPMDIYLKKTLDTEPEKPTSAMETGNRLEKAILDWAEDRLGWAIDRPNKTIVASDGILSATPDGFIPDVDPDKNPPQLVDAKFSSRADEWGEEGTDSIPESYVVQMQHQMLVTGARLVWVPVLLMTYKSVDWRLYRVEANDQLQAVLRDRLIAWWNKHVVPRVPPDDFSVPLDVLKRLKRQPKSTVVLGDDALAAVTAYEMANDAAKEADARLEEAKSSVLAMLGLDDPAEAAELPDGTTLTFFEQNGKRLADLDRLKLDHPAWYGANVSQPRHRVLRIKRPRP